MSLSPVRSALPRRRLVGLFVAALLGFGLALNPATTPKADAAVSASVGARAVKAAASAKGVKYRYGGTSPRNGLDCSGLTKYAYAKVGKRLPRTAAQQYKASIKVSAAKARPGDLVFFMSGKSVYHVAIYAGKVKGKRYIWHAPKPGKRVAKVPLWTSKVKYGRVR